jgi:hypothetical protein
VELWCVSLVMSSVALIVNDCAACCAEVLGWSILR